MKLKALVEKFQEVLKENPDVELECWIRTEPIQSSGLTFYSANDGTWPPQNYKLEISDRHTVELEVFLDNENKFETWKKQ